jgi:alkanesulfonate monooxygenase SsuD/methylene tetrahydromethanopterin reductase-like flavin-dependent oxidoreductase (luciferase family)
LRLVARRGDASNFGNGDLETRERKLEVLKGHRENEGRDFEEIIRSTSVNVHLLEDGEDPEQATREARGSRSFEEYSQGYMIGTAGEIVERLDPMAEAGIDYFITYLPRIAYDPAPVERFAEEVIPNVG